MIEVPLSRGLVALIDDCDEHLVCDRKWHVAITTTGYRYASARSRPSDGVTTAKIKMHRLIMKPPLGLVVEHVNGDGIDNRRSNMRVVPQSMNIRHGYRMDGVLQKPGSSKWYIRYQNRDGGRTFESGFDTAEQAWHRLRIVRAEMDLADLREAAEIMAAHNAAA